VTIERDVELDICPLCSQVEDHEHNVKLRRKSADLVDGAKLDEDGRKAVVEILRGIA